MALSHEATICLRPPTKLNLPAPTGYQSPTIQFLTGRHWHPVFTTFPLTKYDRIPPRDPSFQLRIAPASGAYTATETWIDPADKPDPLEVGLRPRTSTISGKVLDGSGTEMPQQRVSLFRENDTGRQWEIICWGKQGELESWMIDDDSGWISDSSGERRADWRNFYVVVYYEATAEDEAGIEVWDSIGRHRRLTSLTFKKIQDAMRKVESEDIARFAEKLTEIIPAES